VYPFFNFKKKQFISHL